MSTPTVPLYDVVIPTVGRPSLGRLLLALDRAGGPVPGRVIVVDDRRGLAGPIVLPTLGRIEPRVVWSNAGGPAAARNAGWRRCAARWIVFLDDDVVVTPGWGDRLAVDLRAADAASSAGRPVGASQGRVVVPRPPGARLTDAERNVVSLQGAPYITADMAVRRAALVELGGFDERFRRAYREDTELALRLRDAGWVIATGSRTTEHPLRTGTWRDSVGAQRGNADDALMRRLHGPEWRSRGRVPRGRLRAHVITTGVLAAAGVAALVRRPRLAGAAGAAAALRVVRFWWSRVRPGPWSPAEWARMAVSSALIPVSATWWALAGRWRARALAPAGSADCRAGRVPALVLFDRDGTLVHDVPYNGDPARVVPVEGARDALDRLRAAGVQVGIFTNQSGVGRGLITRAQADAVTSRVTDLLGPFATVQTCPHAPGTGCACRKPRPGMVRVAAADVGVAPADCAVVGDIGADVEAGLAAGARAILVPTADTWAEEIANAPERAANLAAAVDLLLGLAVEPAGADELRARPPAPELAPQFVEAAG